MNTWKYQKIYRNIGNSVTLISTFYYRAAESMSRRHKSRCLYLTVSPGGETRTVSSWSVTSIVLLICSDRQMHRNTVRSMRHKSRFKCCWRKPFQNVLLMVRSGMHISSSYWIQDKFISHWISQKLLTVLSIHVFVCDIVSSNTESMETFSWFCAICCQSYSHAGSIWLLRVLHGYPKGMHGQSISVYSLDSINL